MSYAFAMIPKLSFSRTYFATIVLEKVVQFVNNICVFIQHFDYSTMACFFVTEGCIQSVFGFSPPVELGYFRHVVIAVFIFSLALTIVKKGFWGGVLCVVLFACSRLSFLTFLFLFFWYIFSLFLIQHFCPL